MMSEIVRVIVNTAKHTTACWFQDLRDLVKDHLDLDHDTAVSMKQAQQLCPLKSEAA